MDSPTVCPGSGTFTPGKSGMSWAFFGLFLAFSVEGHYNRSNDGVSCHPKLRRLSQMKAKTNLTMLCDFYELTMANGYFQTCLLYTSRCV